jgi:cytochrome P450
VIGRPLPPPGPPLPRQVQSLAFAFAPMRFIEACRRRYGDVVAFRTVANPRFVMVFDPELVKQVFGGPPEQLRTGEARAKLAPLVGRRSVLMLDGDEHMRRRRLLLPPFHGELMRAHTQEIQDATDRMIDSWPTGQPFPLLPSMQALTLDVIVTAVFGEDHGPGQEQFTDEIRAVLDPFRPRRLRTLRSVDPTAQRRLISELIHERISRRRGAPDLAARKDVFSLLLLARDENQSAMTDDELCDDLVALIFAGNETTPHALAWAFELLMRNPAVLERLEAELANGDGVYLNAVVKETLRLRAPVVHVGRVVRGQPYRLGDHLIQPGTEIRASIAAIHGRADHYREPGAFIPERFLDCDPPDTYTWLPFGGGVRRCLGASFAMLEMAVIVRRVLERTRLTPARRRPEKAVLDGTIQVPARGVRVVKLARAAL